MSGERERAVDCEMAKRGVWLVKVPRYLSEIWEANAGTDVDRFVIQQGVDGKVDLHEICMHMGQNHQIGKVAALVGEKARERHTVKLKSRPGLTLPQSVLSTLEDASQMLDEHSFILGDILNKTMVVLAEDKSELNEDVDDRSGRLSIEGVVVKRAECCPPASDSYLKMKIAQISRGQHAKKHAPQMKKAAVKFKPIAAYAEGKKKERSRAVRADRSVVMQTLFQAFEKHQCYRWVT